MLIFPNNYKDFKDLCYLYFKTKENSQMFWKIAFGLGVLGVILSIIIFIVSYRALNVTKDPNTETIAFIGIIASILLTLFSIVLILVSIIFVLRNSKKDFDAKNAK